MSGSRIRIGARNSPLARVQADLTANALKAYGVDSEFVPISTRGDVDSRELTQIGGTGVFTSAVRDALLDGSIDVGVHSLKDLPTAPADGLEMVAYPEREDTREVLVGRWLDDPGPGPIVIGTGAPRRAAQLRQLAADRDVEVQCKPIRGNVDTRIRQVRDGAYDATVLAAAGLLRLGRMTLPPSARIEGLPARVLAQEELLCAPGQGALGIEVSTKLDSDIRTVLTRLDHAATRTEVLAERRFLAVLEAGCTAPVGARAAVRNAGADLTLVAVIGRTKGDDRSHSIPDNLTIREKLITATAVGPQADPAGLGERLARQVLTIIDPDEL